MQNPPGRDVLARWAVRSALHWAGSDSNRRLADYESAAANVQGAKNAGVVKSSTGMAAPGAARSVESEGETAQLDPDLTRLIDAWPELPEAIRAGIVAMVRAYDPKA